MNINKYIFITSSNSYYTVDKQYLIIVQRCIFMEHINEKQALYQLLHGVCIVTKKD